MPKFLLDSSALLALIQNEPGADIIAKNLDYCSISAVNVAETFTKLIRKGVLLNEVKKELERTVKQIIPFDADLARLTGELAINTNHLGLSLGDRACIATAMILDFEILTCDTEWKQIELPVQLKFIR